MNWPPECPSEPSDSLVVLLGLLAFGALVYGVIRGLTSLVGRRRP